MKWEAGKVMKKWSKYGKSVKRGEIFLQDRNTCKLQADLLIFLLLKIKTFVAWPECSKP